MISWLKKVRIYTLIAVGIRGILFTVFVTIALKLFEPQIEVMLHNCENSLNEVTIRAAHKCTRMHSHSSLSYQELEWQMSLTDLIFYASDCLTSSKSCEGFSTTKLLFKAFRKT